MFIRAVNGLKRTHSLWQRRSLERRLDAFARREPKRFQGTVLIDGMWDNPNYFARYTILRAALGLAHADEVGLVGGIRARLCAGTFAAWKIPVVNWQDIAAEVSGKAREIAGDLLSGPLTPDDVLRWELPFGFPASFLYDTILKRQRQATVRTEAPDFRRLVETCVSDLLAADRILGMKEFRLLALSHAIGSQFGGLAWRGVQLGIPTVVLFGAYGACRFWKVDLGDGMFNQAGAPSPQDIISRSPSDRAALAAAGERYLATRYGGRTDDVGAVYAYGRPPTAVDRTAIMTRFGWTEDRPIVAVYASTFFDYPHGVGMSRFRDFVEWLQETARACQQNRDVYWLFRGHPADEWYRNKGMLAKELTGLEREHLRITPYEWNGASFMESVDAIVTHHGTIGIEAAAAGKPVMIADRGWYHDAGFVHFPSSRDEYLTALLRPWWEGMNLSEARRRALEFAGTYFCFPNWQMDGVFEDDSTQERTFPHLRRMWNGNSKALRRDIEEVRAWLDFDHRDYHVFKMARSTAFAHSSA